MENRKIKHSYDGMQQDITQSQFSQNFYYEGRNIRLNATNSQSTNSVTNEKGNSLILTIPTPVINNSNPSLKKIIYGNKELIYKTSEIDNLPSSGEQIIIGHTNSRKNAILFTTDDNGFNCVWKVNYESYDLTLLYLRNLGFSINNPIQALNNFENENIDKVYWVDGINQMRFINTEHSIENQDLEELIDVSQNVIDMVGKTILEQPIITDITTGGVHTAGMIQYAYNLYRINSSQTKISPLSKLVSLDKGIAGGGALNELVGAIPIVSITNLDTSYTNIKVYAIKYTSFNEIPSISLIDDRAIPSNGNIEIFDDGIIINTISAEKFIFLGSDVIIPKHINTKFNRLFFANYKEVNFDVDLDTRAYSYNNSGSADIYKDLKLTLGVPDGTKYTISNDSQYDDPLLNKHDSVNLNYNVFKYQKDGFTFGGEGKYIKYELTQTTVFNKKAKYFKDEEIYRIGVEFYNNYGQLSLPKWVADIKSRDGNLAGNYNTFKLTLKPAFFTWLNTTSFNSIYDIPVGYRVIVAERTINDRSIIANGLVSPMMINWKTDYNPVSIVPPSTSIINSLPKLPNILVRNCNNTTLNGNTQPLRKAQHLRGISDGYNTADTEMQRAISIPGNTTNGDAKTFQFNSMLQLYSPEILFGNSISISDNLKMRIKGSLKNSYNSSWVRRYRTDLTIEDEGKAFNGISPNFSLTDQSIIGNVDFVLDRGLISHPGGSSPYRVIHSIFNREYGDVNPELNVHSNYIKSPVSTVVDIYGKPEITELGQDGTNYNNDPNYRYINSLESVLTDNDATWGGADDGTYGRRIISIRSHGNRCVTLVTGSDDPLVTHDVRPLLENICTSAGITGDNNGLIAEIIKTDNEIYLGNMYGGNSYEDKKRSNYVEVGEFVEFDSLNPSKIIDSPGDTFVNGFRFIRIVRTDSNSINEGIYVLEELVEFLTETTVDLANRNDLSLSTWDTRFQPINSEYHKYNKVYSQQSNLIQKRDLNYNIKKVNNLDTNIISTKLKSAGELIDNWTDILTNEVMTLDGKHGAINNLASFNDELYTIQDKAFAFLSISPRVQITGGDGLAVQLGTGGVLDKYQYISTESGTVNKWSVVPTSKGIYYYDLLNKSFMVFSGQVDSVSDTKMMHSYFTSNTELEGLKIDNPLIKQGISSGYDQINKDVFMTFHRINDKTPFTVSFNESRNQFISFYDYIPSMYISKGQYFITTSPNLKSIYRQYAGNYGNFYGINYPSYVVLNVNPEANMDTVFDNIIYKSEVYLNDLDQFDKTLTKVRLYSEYQDSGLIPLTLSRTGNIRRKFRDWNAILPRNQGSRERIRNPWVKLVLQFDNTNNYKLILHDIVVTYSV